MFEEQTIVEVTEANLAKEVHRLCEEGYRLVQMGCTQVNDQFMLDYSFDRDNHFYNLRLAVSMAKAEIPSISNVFLAAFLYENEIHDLFGIRFPGLKIDYQGKLYRIEKATPFCKNPTQSEEKKD